MNRGLHIILFFFPIILFPNSIFFSQLFFRKLPIILLLAERPLLAEEG